MRKSYVLVYNDQLGDRDIIKSWADISPLVITWRYDLPHCFYLISEASAKELATDLRETLGSGRFIITEYAANSYGWLARDTWYFLQQKKSKPKTE